MKFIKLQIKFRKVFSYFLPLVLFFFGKERIFKIGKRFFLLKIYELIHIIEIFGLKQYDCFRYSKNLTVIDIGAHKGIYSLYVSEKVKKVIAIEPEEENFKKLLYNIKINRAKNVLPLRFAVSNKTGELNLYVHFLTGMSSLKTEKGTVKIEKVHSITLGQILKFCKSKNVLIKMDVEGLEATIIKNSRKLIEKIKPKFVIEIHNKEVYSECMEFFKEIGYKVSSFNLFFGPIFVSTILCAEVKK